MVRTAPTPALILGASAVTYIGAALFLRKRLSTASLYTPLHDTFFVVAHLHPFVLGALICAMFALMYWAMPRLSQGGVRKWLANFHALSMAAVPLLILVATLVPISDLQPYGPGANRASGLPPGFWIEPLMRVGILLALLFGNFALVCASIIALVKRTG